MVINRSLGVRLLHRYARVLWAADNKSNENDNYSIALNEAVNDAVQAGIVVVAAAGDGSGSPLFTGIEVDAFYGCSHRQH